MIVRGPIRSVDSGGFARSRFPKITIPLSGHIEQPCGEIIVHMDVHAGCAVGHASKVEASSPTQTGGEMKTFCTKLVFT